MIEPNAYLVASAVAGTSAAIVGAQIVDLPNTERLGTAGLITVGAALLLKWALAQIGQVTDQARGDREAFLKAILDKDGQIAVLNKEIRETLVTDIRNSVSLKAELNVTLKEHSRLVREMTAAILRERSEHRLHHIDDREGE